MKKNNRILSLLSFNLILCFGLCSCGETSSSVNNSSSPTSGGITDNRKLLDVYSAIRNKETVINLDTIINSKSTLTPSGAKKAKTVEKKSYLTGKAYEYQANAIKFVDELNLNLRTQVAEVPEAGKWFRWGEDSYFMFVNNETTTAYYQKTKVADKFQYSLFSITNNEKGNKVFTSLLSTGDNSLSYVKYVENESYYLVNYSIDSAVSKDNPEGKKTVYIDVQQMKNSEENGVKKTLYYQYFYSMNKDVVDNGHDNFTSFGVIKDETSHEWSLGADNAIEEKVYYQGNLAAKYVNSGTKVDYSYTPYSFNNVEIEKGTINVNLGPNSEKPLCPDISIYDIENIKKIGSADGAQPFSGSFPLASNSTLEEGKTAIEAKITALGGSIKDEVKTELEANYVTGYSGEKYIKDILKDGFNLDIDYKTIKYDEFIAKVLTNLALNNTDIVKDFVIPENVEDIGDLLRGKTVVGEDGKEQTIIEYPVLKSSFAVPSGLYKKDGKTYVVSSYGSDLTANWNNGVAKDDANLRMVLGIKNRQNGEVTLLNSSDGLNAKGYLFEGTIEGEQVDIGDLSTYAHIEINELKTIIKTLAEGLYSLVTRIELKKGDQWVKQTPEEETSVDLAFVEEEEEIYKVYRGVEIDRTRFIEIGEYSKTYYKIQNS